MVIEQLLELVHVFLVVWVVFVESIRVVALLLIRDIDFVRLPRQRLRAVLMHLPSPSARSRLSERVLPPVLVHVLFVVVRTTGGEAVGESGEERLRT